MSRMASWTQQDPTFEDVNIIYYTTIIMSKSDSKKVTNKEWFYDKA